MEIVQCNRIYYFSIHYSDIMLDSIDRFGAWSIEQKRNRTNVFFDRKKLVTVNTPRIELGWKIVLYSLRIITFGGENIVGALFDISMYYGILSTFALKRCLLFLPHLFLKGLFVFVACPVLATRKAPRCQRFDCPRDLFFQALRYYTAASSILCVYIYMRKRLHREGEEGMGHYHCNGVVSTLDSDRFPGAKAHVCTYIIWNGSEMWKKKKSLG